MIDFFYTANQNMIKKINELILTKEKVNIQLAFELIKGQNIELKYILNGLLGTEISLNMILNAKKKYIAAGIVEAIFTKNEIDNYINTEFKDLVNLFCNYDYSHLAATTINLPLRCTKIPACIFKLKQLEELYIGSTNIKNLNVFRTAFPNCYISIHVTRKSI